MAKNGQLYGNATPAARPGSPMAGISPIPGYNEIFTGLADPLIDSNDKRDNGNVTVLEWLNGQDDFHRRIAAFGSWDLFPTSSTVPRSQIRVVAGWKPLVGRGLSHRREIVEPPDRRNAPASGTTAHTIPSRFMRRLNTSSGSGRAVMYIGLGETDEFGHAGRYDHYLHAAITSTATCESSGIPFSRSPTTVAPPR